MAVHTIRSLSDFDAYINSIEAKVQAVLDGVADVGVRTANAAYKAEMAHRESEPKKAKVVATGEGLGFLEFGAGTKVDTSDPFANLVGYIVASGSWSAEHGKTYQAWIAGGRVGEYRYNFEPRRGMYEASKEMRANVGNQIRTVFR